MTRITATALMGFETTGNRRRRMTSEEAAELERVGSSFHAFLSHWHFKNRETGAVSTMANLWPGQQRFADLMLQENRILALKAGKLGFTELECAWDAWVLLFSQPNARVHLFSKEANAAASLLEYVAFGLAHLPWYMQLPVVARTTETLRLRAGPDDERVAIAYASSPNAAIDQSATHSHVDELARMLHGEQTWQAIQSCIAPGGTCHIVTRGAGDANFVAQLWEQAVAGTADLAAFFAPYTERPGRDAAWREEEAGSLNRQGLLFFAPESPDDALAGDDTAEYLAAASWDRSYDPALPELDRKTPIVLALDAAVTGDCFAAVAASRHPLDSTRPAIRAVKLWKPSDFAGGRIDFLHVQWWVERVCRGVCANGHVPSQRDPTCAPCRTGTFNDAYNVVQIAYDPYQLEGMAQQLRREGVTWVKEFNQGEERWIADSALHKYVLTGQLAHDGDKVLREHVLNARAKLQKDEDSKMRMIKKAPNRHIDAAVAAAMAVNRVMYLNV